MNPESVLGSGGMEHIQPQFQVGIPLPAREMERIAFAQDGSGVAGGYTHSRFAGSQDHVGQAGMQGQGGHVSAVIADFSVMV
jgi:hypothetical protein